MAKYRVTYWRDIPQSFTVEGDGRTVKKQLSQKVQNKIDACAMAIGATSTTDYAKEYKRGEWIEREGAPEEVAEALLSELEAAAAMIAIPRREPSLTPAPLPEGEGISDD
jgi:metal-dependent amidase/aminoacylase/carboxypeptidase family protein